LRNGRDTILEETECSIPILTRSLVLLTSRNAALTLDAKIEELLGRPVADIERVARAALTGLRPAWEMGSMAISRRVASSLPASLYTKCRLGGRPEDRDW
jgi:hypothetical protein